MEFIYCGLYSTHTHTQSNDHNLMIFSKEAALYIFIVWRHALNFTVNWTLITH